MRLFILASVVACASACNKSTSPPPIAPIPPPSVAEVEMNINVTTQVDAGRLVTFITTAPCDSEGAGKGKLGLAEARLGAPTFMEVFVPQGTRGYVCAAALDAAGNLVGLGAAEHNPLNLSGEGEVTFRPAIRILPLPAARPPPQGLLVR